MPRSLERKLISITWPFAAIVILMLSLSLISMNIMSAARAYVGGEGQWSKAERDAVSRLLRFYRSHASEDYTDYLQALAVPLGDRRARLAMLQPDPDRSAATLGLLAGQNDPADIPGMIRLFTAFRNIDLFRRAITIWDQGDEQILRLKAVGERLRAEVNSGGASAAQIDATEREIEAIHRRVAPLEDQFSATIGAICRSVARMLLLVLSASGLVLLLIGGVISRNFLRRAELIEAALNATKALAYAEHELAQVTLRSIGDAVISSDEHGRIHFLNAAAEALTGWSAADARNRPLGEVFQVPTPPGGPPAVDAILRSLSDGRPSAPGSATVLIRRDGTRTPVNAHAAPIRDKGGDVVGIVLVLRDVTQELALAAQLQHQASHDALTGLANRGEFERRLRLAIGRHAALGGHEALLYLDLDQFKVINDTCGHGAGDELIRQISATMQLQLAAGDTLARLGGDEFGVLLPDCTAERALSTANAMCRRISESRFAWQGKSFAINASIGILSIGDTPMSVSEALSAADRACYAAKDNGRNRVHVYRPDDDELRARHGEMQWVERITNALEHGRFVLYAQEIKPISTSAGDRADENAPRFEVLLRMLDEQDRYIAPMAFIPAAERYGLMSNIDRWVIAQACHVLGERHAATRRVPACTINLSAASLTDQSFVDFVAGCIAGNGLRPESIGFELTETAAVSNLSNASQLMGRLKSLGCSIALDDFGSGMSSFAYLRSLPIDCLKIDGKFVKDMTHDAVDYAMVEAIQRIGRVIGIKTVAESVEDEATLGALALIGVNYAQGFGIGPPMPLRQWLQLWDERQPDAPAADSASSSLRALKR